MEYDAEQSDFGRRVVCELCGNGFVVGGASAPKKQGGKVPYSTRVENVPSHMVGAILSTIFCCQIGGVIAIVYALQVNSKLAKGDIEGAKSNSTTAKRWIIASIVIGVLLVLLLGLNRLVLGVSSAPSKDSAEMNSNIDPETANKEFLRALRAALRNDDMDRARELLSERGIYYVDINELKNNKRFMKDDAWAR